MPGSAGWRGLLAMLAAVPLLRSLAGPGEPGCRPPRAAPGGLSQGSGFAALAIPGVLKLGRPPRECLRCSDGSHGLGRDFRGRVVQMRWRATPQSP